jgi:hypothetical protein
MKLGTWKATFRVWQPHELEFVRVNFQNHTQEWMAAQLGRSFGSVHHKVRRARMMKFKRHWLRRRMRLAPAGLRFCTGCERNLELSQFYAQQTGPGGRQTRCKKCVDDRAIKYRQAKPEQYRAIQQRAARMSLKRKYQLTDEQVDRLLSQRTSGLCAICDKRRRLNIDHDHSSGKVRGLLCTTCNHALGVFGDNETGLLRALAYVRSTSF